MVVFHFSFSEITSFIQRPEWEDEFLFFLSVICGVEFQSITISWISMGVSRGLVVSVYTEGLASLDGVVIGVVDIGYFYFMKIS